jgi:hypothetical protein
MAPKNENKYLFTLDLSEYFETDERGWLIMSEAEAYSILGGDADDPGQIMDPMWFQVVYIAKTAGIMHEDRDLPLGMCAFSPEFFKHFAADGDAWKEDKK